MTLGVTDSCYAKDAAVSFIARRQGSVNYYYRETTPADVKQLLIRLHGSAPSEVWVSLRTPDRREANARLARVRGEQHRKWDEVRSSAQVALRIPTKRELAEAVAEFVHEKFVAVHRQQLRDRLNAGLDPAAEARRRRQKIAQAELMPSPSDVSDMERLAAALCTRKGWSLRLMKGADGDEGQGLVALVTKAVQHARGDIVETLEGRPPERTRNDVLDKLGAGVAHKARTGEAIMELFDRYEEDSKRAGKSTDTLSTERQVMGHFATFVGRDRSITDIGRSDIREFKRALAGVPIRWTARPQLKGLALREAASAWTNIGGSVRSMRTVNRELSAVSAFYAWLVENAYVDENIANGFRAKIDKTQGKYPPYTYNELRRLFATPLFTECDRAKEHLPGDDQVRDWRYWIPLCALYSGARAGEIAQLLCADVREEEGVWVFDVNEEAQDVTKSLKSASSRRLVPVHPSLVRLGFLDHVKAVQAAGGLSLFPDLKPGPRNNMSYHPSRFWQRYLHRVGMKRTGLGLHSFRHTFADECRRRGVDAGILQVLLGHADHSITAHYGTLANGNLDQRFAAIKALGFGDLHPPLDERPG